MAQASRVGTISRFNAASRAGSFFYGFCAALSTWPQADSAKSTHPPVAARSLVPAGATCGCPWRSSIARVSSLLSRLVDRLRTIAPAVPHGGAPGVCEALRPDRPSPTAPWGLAPGLRGGRSSRASILPAVPSGWPRGVPARGAPGWLDGVSLFVCGWASHVQLLSHGFSLISVAWYVPGLLTTT
jgi:hypothetical protein